MTSLLYRRRQRILFAIRLEHRSAAGDSDPRAEDVAAFVGAQQYVHGRELGRLTGSA